MLWGMITAPTIPTAYHKRNEKKIVDLIFVFLLPQILFTDNERANNKSLFESEDNHMIKNQHKTLT